jgi:hypothetical protein
VGRLKKSRLALLENARHLKKSKNPQHLVTTDRHDAQDYLLSCQDSYWHDHDARAPQDGLAF